MNAPAASTAEPQLTVTDYFSVPAHVVAWHRLRPMLLRWGPVVMLLPLGLLVTALLTHDLRWALLGLMAVMVVVPMLMLPAYYSALLRPEAARAVLPHRLIIRHGVEVTVEYLRDPDSPRPVPADEVIPWHRIALLRHRPPYWLLLLR